MTTLLTLVALVAAGIACGLFAEFSEQRRLKSMADAVRQRGRG